MSESESDNERSYLARRVDREYSLNSQLVTRLDRLVALNAVGIGLVLNAASLDDQRAERAFDGAISIVLLAGVGLSVTALVIGLIGLVPKKITTPKADSFLEATPTEDADREVKELKTLAAANDSYASHALWVLCATIGASIAYSITVLLVVCSQ